MPDSQNFDQTSNSTLTKLQEVDSELAVQERELLSQLESLQEKRRSLKTVIDLFTEADTSQIQPAEPEEPKNNGIDEDLAVPPLATPEEPATAEPEPETVTDSDNGAKKQTSPNRGNKTTKSRHPAKAVKKTLGWQDYVREEFRNVSLVEAVTAILQRYANRVLDIPAVVKGIFIDDLPKEIGYKARRQVTNILSDGTRKNKWYRGQSGYYSMSRAAFNSLS